MLIGRAVWALFMKIIDLRKRCQLQAVNQKSYMSR